MKVKKNDTVYVVTGKDAGKTGKVLSADPKNNKVVVEGVNVQKKHYKARRQGEVSAIKPQSGPIDASNVNPRRSRRNHPCQNSFPGYAEDLC